MDRRATKDHYERETEEAERLVRPAPKVKPKRTDLRRERMDAERDPDTDGDPDLKGDPDLSLNYKNVGGSAGSRVAARFLRADLDRSGQGRENLIKVRKKDTGNVTYVTKERLKDEGSTYEVVEDDAGGKAPEEKPEADEPKSKARKEYTPEDIEQLRSTLKTLDEGDPNFVGAFGRALNPADEWAKLPDDTPLTDFSDLRPLVKDYPTLGDLRALGDEMAAHPERFAPPKQKKKPKQTKPAPAAPSEPLPPSTSDEKPGEPAPSTPAVPETAPETEGPAQPADSTPSSSPETKADGGAVPPSEDSKTEDGPPQSKTPEGESTKPEEPKVDEPSTPEAKQPKKAQPPKPPQRRPFSERERLDARAQLIEEFSYDAAKQLLQLNLHPDDVKELVTTQRLMRTHSIKSVSDALELVGGQYQTDPSKIPPPKLGGNSAGVEVPLSDLTPDEQLQATQKHRMRVLAVNLTARQAVMDRLERKTGAPEELLGTLADFTLNRPTGESDAQRVERARKDAQDLFAKTVAKGQLEDQVDNSRFLDDDDELTPDPSEVPVAKEMAPTREHLTKILREFSADPATQQVAVGYLQAADYLDVRKNFLSSEAPEDQRISERQSPREIWRRLQRALKVLDARDRSYPSELKWLNDPSEGFRRRILDKVRTLAPEKYNDLVELNQEYSIKEYERKSKEWERTFEKNEHYRQSGQPLPPKPVPPAGSEAKGAGTRELKKQRNQLLEGIRRQMGLNPDEGTPAEVTRQVLAAIVVSRHCGDSSYPSRLAMASTPKKAVYHGLQPYADTAPYVKWQQIHQCELGEADHNALLKSAREWLRAPVLSENVEGIVKDTQLRAALDLAIRDHANGVYSVGLPPPVYNMLLARLAGVSQSEPLLTVEASSKQACGACACGGETPNDSLYAPTGGEPPMKASAQIRSLAARYASVQPELAFDLIDLAVKIAEDEQQQAEAPTEESKQAGLPPEFLEQQKSKKDDGEDEGQQKQAYQTLRSHVIHIAHANPHLREAYLPLLQAIKQIG